MADKNVARREVVEIGFEVDDKGLTSFEQKMNSTKSETQKVFESMQGSTSRFGNEINELAEKMGVTYLKADRISSSFSKLEGQTSSSVRAQSEFTSAIEKAGYEIEKYSESGKLSAQTLSGLSESEKAAKAAVSELEAAQKQAETASQAYDQALLSDNVTLKELQSVSISAEEATRNLADAETKAKEAVEKLNAEMDDAGISGENAKTGIAGASDALNNLLVAAGGYKLMGLIKTAFTEVTSAAIEFESAIAGVYKTVDGTQSQLQQLSDDVMEMSTRIPATTTEIAGVMESAGQLGINTDAITSFTETMVNLGTATNMTSDAAASMLAKFANITGMDQSNFSNLGSVVVDLGNKFATTESDIVSMSTRLASAASLAGMSQSDIMGLSTAMSSVGIQAEAGGSSMSKLITQMQLAVETGDGLDEFASISNMSAQQFSQAWGDNAVSALQSFIVGLNDTERNGASAAAVLDQMGLDGIILSNTIRALAGSEGLLTNAVNTANQAWEENSALTNEADKRYNTLESKLQMTENAANNLKIEVGNSLTPVLSDLNDAAKSALEGLTGFAKDNQALTAGFMGFAGSIGTVASGLMALAPTITAVSTAYKALDKTISLSKIGIAVGVFSALVGVGVGLYTAFSDAEEVVEDYNGTLEQCRNELDATQEKYNAVVSVYGEQSEAAKALAKDIDLLNKQYEQGGGAAEDYAQRLEEINSAYDDTRQKYEDQIEELNKSQISGQTAIAMLQMLSDKAVKTSSDFDMMRQYAEALNNDYHMNISVDYTGNIESFDAQTLANKMYDETLSQKKKISMEKLMSTETRDTYLEYKNGMADLTAEYRDTLIDLNKFEQEYIQKVSGGMSPDVISEFQNFKNGNYEDYLFNLYGNNVPRLVKNMQADTGFWDEYNQKKEKLISLQGDMENYKKSSDSFIEEMKADAENAGVLDSFDTLIESYDKYGTMINDNVDYINKALTPDNAAGEAFQTYRTQIEALAETYAENCASIKSNLDSMFSLFEQAPDFKTPEGLEKALQDTISLKDAVSGLQSEIDYFNKYQEALSDLQKFGMDYDIAAQLNPEQAVRFANELNNMSLDDAKTEMQELNDKYKELEKTKESVSQSMGEYSIAEELEQIKKDAKGKIDEIAKEMNFTEDAKKSAYTTMNGYLSEIIRGGDQAVKTAQGIAARISSALNVKASVNVNTNYTSSSQLSGAQASGTLSAPRGFNLVGEEGPEIVWFNGGERVFNNADTNEIISALRKPDDVSVYIPKSVDEAVNYTPEKDAERTVINNNDNSSTSNNSNVNNNNYNFESYFEFNGVSANEQRKITQLVKQALKEMLEESSSGQSVIER